MTTWKERFRPQPEREPQLTLLEPCGRLRSLQKSTRVLECGIYRTEAPGLEVRCGYSDEDLLRSQRTAEIGSARELAEQWRQAVLAKGGVDRWRLIAPPAAGHPSRIYSCRQRCIDSVKVTVLANAPI